MTHNDVNANATALYQHIYALVNAAKEAANLPKCEDEVAAMLDTLAEADAEMKAYFVKFKTDAERASEECNAAWTIIYNKRESAYYRLTRYAVARREAASMQKAA